MIILRKDHFDEEIINSALQKHSENVDKELKQHFVFAGYNNLTNAGHDNYINEHKLRSLIMYGMNKHKIKSVMVTSIDLYRDFLITKEKMESYCKGEERVKDSVNDDLESLFENIRLGRETNERVITYFLPKLTEEELKLVEGRDTSYLQTFRWSNEADVAETKMMLSESDSKYVQGLSFRRTFVIETPFENFTQKFIRKFRKRRF